MTELEGGLVEKLAQVKSCLNDKEWAELPDNKKQVFIDIVLRGKEWTVIRPYTQALYYAAATGRAARSENFARDLAEEGRALV